MTYLEEKKKVEKLAKRKNFKREDVEFIFEYLLNHVTIESYSSVRNVREQFGFKR
jgi:hypothetical protein